MAKATWVDVAGLALGIASLALGVAGYLAYRKTSMNEKDDSPDGGQAYPDVLPGESVRLVGDSIGVGLEPQLRKLFEGSGHPFSSRVKVGESITSLRPKLTDADTHANVVLVSLGSNDAAFPNPSSETAALEGLVAELGKNGARVYWIRPPAFVRGQENEKQAEVSNMMLAHLTEVVAPLPSVASDAAMHLHPTPQGYKDYADALYTALTVTPENA